MKGDFTRSTHDPRKHYSSVRMQQGRVQLDADWNEQVEIEARLRETALQDVIGRSGAPRVGGGFRIEASPDRRDLYISPGRYYVDGILCELDAPEGNRPLSFIDQFSTLSPPVGIRPPLPSSAGIYFAYLDVWQRHVTAIEDPSIRETALGGADTATRTQTFWQVRLFRAGNRGLSFGCTSAPTTAIAEIAPSNGRLRARTNPAPSTQDPCAVPGSAGYTRPENQLYRVEVHNPGGLGTATFKWSRDNGSVVTEWVAQDPQDPTRITVGSTGPDSIIGFAPGQWIELIDDTNEINGAPGTFIRIARVEGNTLILTQTSTTVQRPSSSLHPRIRRWDTAPGTTSATMPTTLIRNSGDGTNGGWLPLEGGIEVFFEAGTYRTGDYWLIPARSFAGGVAGAIEWPSSGGLQLPLPPHGVTHHYSRLAVIDYDGSVFTVQTDCRPVFSAITEQVITAAQVTYDPSEFPGLSSLTNVQSAVTEALKRAGVQENAVRITRVEWADRSPVSNDTLISATRLAAGIRFVCDRTVSEDAFLLDHLPGTSLPSPNKPNCGVIVDLPYSLPGDSGWPLYQILALGPSGTAPATPGIPFGFLPITLQGAVSVRDNVITWSPSLAALWLRAGLFDRLFGLHDVSGANGAGRRLADRVLVRFFLKGSFIWSDDDPTAYLDGESYGEANGTTTGFRTTGDGRRGGDLEGWVWMTRHFNLSVPLFSYAATFTGTVRDASGRFGTSESQALSGVRVALLDASGAQLSETTSGSNGSFSLTAPRPGSYHVKATRTINGRSENEIASFSHLSSGSNLAEDDGGAVSESLAAAGITQPEQIASMEPERLAELLDISMTDAQLMVKSFKKPKKSGRARSRKG